MKRFQPLMPDLKWAAMEQALRTSLFLEAGAEIRPGGSYRAMVKSAGGRFWKLLADQQQKIPRWPFPQHGDPFLDDGE